MTVLGHRIELSPLSEQIVYFSKACGVSRFAYNWGLKQWEEQYNRGEKPTWMGLKKTLNALKKEHFPWMYEVTKCAPEGALSNLGTAFSNFFRDVKKPKSTRKAAYPKLKKKGKSKDTFYLSNDQFSVHEKHVYMPHIGKVAITESLRFSGRILSATVSRQADRWFISILVDTDTSHQVRKNQASVGVDLGIHAAITLSTGQQYFAPKSLEKNLLKLEKSNRQLHRKQKGSNRRFKARMKVARLHRRIGNTRNDWLHKATTNISNRFGVVGVEDLNIKGMMSNPRLARSISDIGWGELIRQLEYKAKLRENHVLFVGRFFPSTRQCRKCNTKNTAMTLGDRVFMCVNSACRHREDRDVHAARNIRQECLKQSTTDGQSGSYVRGQSSSTRAERKRFGDRKMAGGYGKNVKHQETVSGHHHDV